MFFKLTFTLIYIKLIISMNNKAFTLVEIMIVVGIIALLAAISIPLMIRNQMTTNEAVASASCRTIVSAMQSYYAVNTDPATGLHTYPPDLATLGTSGAGGPAYIDTLLASGQRTGYTYTYNLINPIFFTLNVDPLYPGRTGNRYFYTDETGRITAKTGGQAGPDDPVVQ